MIVPPLQPPRLLWLEEPLQETGVQNVSLRFLASLLRGRTPPSQPRRTVYLSPSSYLGSPGRRWWSQSQEQEEVSMLLILYIMFMAPSFVLGQGIADSACKMTMIGNVNNVVESGDLIIGGIIKLSDESYGYFLPSIGLKKEMQNCNLLQLNFWRHLLAFIFALEEINSRSDILPNITLGYNIYDSCSLGDKAVQSALSILSARAEAVPNYNCDEKNNVVAFIGHLMSASSLFINQIIRIYGYPQVNRYLQTVNFTTPGGEELHFNENRSTPARFDVLNYYILNTSKEITRIGYFNDVGGDQQFMINDSDIHWDPKFTQTPQSLCNPRCLHGYRKVLHEEKPRCCYYCVPCPEGEISNQTDMETCLKCSRDQWSNERRDSCILRAVEFLSYEETLGLSLVVLAVVLCLLTAVILGIFIRHKDTAIVKANNQNLSFILLLTLILSSLCPFLFIGHPTETSCLLRQVAFSNIFTVSVSTILVKTITVILAFRATKPDTRLRRWLGRQFSSGLLIIFSSVEVVICVFWLSFSPPFPYQDTTTEIGKIILHCDEGSIVAFYVAIGYVGLLAVLSFAVAFFARKLPDTFNEAQYISFSMLVFCSLWISFILAYLSTKGKYMVAVEVLTIEVSGAGLLICIFIPKCYIILLRPELNVRGNLIIKKTLKITI
ncbi:vomeronasal type-2 receptor 26-like [Engystomops pustulosus]|uniref:vomeronasal type-2 receptor 26-like n=1 Tax=Engystomops pustulosus TaxID=76066 RepID=UPI003AFA48D8